MSPCHNIIYIGFLGEIILICDFVFWVVYMKLYVGSRNYKPTGYLTVDIDPVHNPDIVADVTNMHNVESSSCDEVLASHVLEHISWPDSFKALAEFSRILKYDGVLRIAVPDVMALLQQIKSSDSDFFAMGLIYGVGGRDNSLEVHRFGFTQRMLIDILDVLGFSSYSWWSSPVADASNGWIPTVESHRSGISLNVQCRKVSEPIINTSRMFGFLLDNPLQNFRLASRKCLLANDSGDISFSDNVVVYQDLHYQLIEANQRIKFLEDVIANGGA